MNEYVLEARNITKKFPSTIANKNINLNVRKGEILGLIGENGAGKSTLLKILNGHYSYGDFEGKIILNGQEVRFHSPNDAQVKGIGFVPQEISILKGLTIAENIYSSNISKGSFSNKFVNLKKIKSYAQELLESLNIDLDPNLPAKMLTIGQQQLLMVVRALSMSPEILILDEPTTSLGKEDVANLYEVLKNLKRKGTSIIFVTHRLDEIMEITDRVTILRDGCYISTFNKSEYVRDKIIADMIGRELTNMYPKRNVELGEEVLRVESLTVEHPKIYGRNIIQDISLSVRKGEILGLAGLVGAGRTETLQAIFGLVKRKCGEIYINGKEINIKNPSDAKRNGIVYVTEDRKKDGLLFLMNIRNNLMASNMKAISGLGIIKNKTQDKRADKMFKQMRIKADRMDLKVTALSGGNQQKVVIGRALNAEPLILLLDEPTKGIDVGSKNEIYILMNELAAKGVSIILTSCELCELLEMSDRFVVLASGRIAGELDKTEYIDKEVMRLSTS